MLVLSAGHRCQTPIHRPCQASPAIGRQSAGRSPERHLTSGLVSRHCPIPARSRLWQRNQDLLRATIGLAQKLHGRGQALLSGRFPCWNRQMVFDRRVRQSWLRPCGHHRRHSSGHCHLVRGFGPAVYRPVAERLCPGTSLTTFAAHRRRKLV